MRPTLIRSIVALALLALFGTSSRAVAVAADEPALPRYRLHAGQHLAFEGDEVATTRSGRLGLRRTTEAFVVRANADGSWRVILLQRQTRFFERNGVLEDQPERLERYVFDLHPDGRIPQRRDDSYGVLNRVFPRLPRDPRENREGWRFAAADVHHDCRPAPEGGDAAPGRSRYVVVPGSHMWTINGFSAEYVYEFDHEKGLFTANEVQHRVRDRDTRKGTERLVANDEIDPGVLAPLAAEVDRADDAERAYRREMAHLSARADPANAAARLEKIIEPLVAVRDGLESGMLRERLDQIIAQHRASATGTLARIRERAVVVGRPAPTWSVTDIEGRPHALGDYRGKVVVLDFWYRACGWCMRAIPQMEELVKRFEGRPVAVLGMNTDRNVDDARFVVETLKMGYPTMLTDRALAAAYGVQAYPTLFVVDGKGVVRHMHRGYSGTLADEIAAVVEELLAEQD